VNICDDRNRLPEVYEIYFRSIKELGSLPLPYAYFEKLWDGFHQKGGLLILTAFYRRKMVAAMNLIPFKDTIYADLIMSHPEYDFLFPKVRLYMESIRYAWESKRYDYYDFNRTRFNSGVFEHKRKWGGEIRNVHYLYSNDSGQESIFLDPLQKRFDLMSAVFKHMPDVVLKALGKSIRRQAGK
jgi:hypothetical protein